MGDIELEFRGLRSLINQLDENNETAWAKVDDYAALNSCFLSAMMKKYTHQEILALMHESKLPLEQINDIAQYFNELSEE